MEPFNHDFTKYLTTDCISGSVPRQHCHLGNIKLGIPLHYHCVECALYEPCHVPGGWQGRLALSCVNLVRTAGPEPLMLLVVAVNAPRQRHHLPQELLHAVV